MPEMAERNVLFVALQISTRANGGIESLDQILRGLARYRPVVMTNAEGWRAKSWREAAIDVHVVEEQAFRSSFSRRPLRHLAAHARYAFKALQLVRRERCALVFANDPHAMRLMYPLAVLGLVKLAYCMRSTPDPAVAHSGRKYRRFFAAAAANLFLSKEMAGVWAKVTGARIPRLAVTYSAVDKRFFEVERRPDAAPTVLLPGRITPAKRQLEFLEKVGPELARAGIRVWIAGDASDADRAYEQGCSEAAESVGGDVQFLGFRSDMEQLCAKATVVALPSRFEGMARAMIEGMACACPVVSFDVCSANEILGDGAGVVVRDSDWSEFGRALIDLCRDAERNAQMGAFGRRKAAQMFNTEAVAERYEAAFDAVVS